MSRRPEIVVVAGVNGAGKSSIAGATLRDAGGDCYDPDEATRAYLAEGLSEVDANVRAWKRGRDTLRRAIDGGLSFSFETTLGGKTITALLTDAARHGHAVRIWFVGLATPELHVRRVRERVARGGHDIPEDRIRERWQTSRMNLIRLLPHIAEVQLFDNSAEGDPGAGRYPPLEHILHMAEGKIRHLAPLDTIPKWARPIVARAMELDGSAEHGAP